MHCDESFASDKSQDYGWSPQEVARTQKRVNSANVQTSKRSKEAAGGGADKSGKGFKTNLHQRNADAKSRGGKRLILITAICKGGILSSAEIPTSELKQLRGEGRAVFEPTFDKATGASAWIFRASSGTPDYHVRSLRRWGGGHS